MQGEGGIAEKYGTRGRRLLAEVISCQRMGRKVLSTYTARWGAREDWRRI